jgi:hypothetical protein
LGNFSPLKGEIFVKLTIQKQKISKFSQNFVINLLIKKTLKPQPTPGFYFPLSFFSHFLIYKNLANIQQNKSNFFVEFTLERPKFSSIFTKKICHKKTTKFVGGEKTKKKH